MSINVIFMLLCVWIGILQINYSLKTQYNMFISAKKHTDLLFYIKHVNSHSMFVRLQMIKR